MNKEIENEGWTLATNRKPCPIVTPEVKTTHLTDNPYHSLQGDSKESITNLQVIVLDNSDPTPTNNKVVCIDIEEEHNCDFLEESMYEDDRYKKSVVNYLTPEELLPITNKVSGVDVNRFRK